MVLKKFLVVVDLIDFFCDYYDYFDVSFFINLYLINILLIVYISNSNNIF